MEIVHMTTYHKYFLKLELGLATISIALIKLRNFFKKIICCDACKNDKFIICGILGSAT